MGNSVSLEQVQRDAHAACPRSSMPASLQQARDAGVPRQITVCLMPSAPETGSEVSAAGFPIQGGNTSTVHADTTCSPNESSQKVLLWNCNPTDSHLKDQQYAAAVLNTNGSSSNQTSANLNKLLVSSRDHKHAMGPNFDMHPAVSSDVAASLPQSSSSSDSSDSSFQGRSYSNEETMPHGPEHSSGVAVHSFNHMTFILQPRVIMPGDQDVLQQHMRVMPSLVGESQVPADQTLMHLSLLYVWLPWSSIAARPQYQTAYTRFLLLLLLLCR